MTIMRQLRLKYQVSSPCSPVIMDLFCNFNIVALNIMGPWVRLQDVMFGTVNLHHPSMFLVFETHGPFSKVETFWNNLGFNPLFIQEAVGHSSGIWVLSSVIDVTCSLLYSDWRLMFPHALLEVLPMHHNLDHNPLILSCLKVRSRRVKSFHFQAA